MKIACLIFDNDFKILLNLCGEGCSLDTVKFEGGIGRKDRDGKRKIGVHAFLRLKVITGVQG